MIVKIRSSSHTELELMIAVPQQSYKEVGMGRPCMFIYVVFFVCFIVSRIRPLAFLLDCAMARACFEFDGFVTEDRHTCMPVAIVNTAS